jgi:hypothetical protein
MLLVAVAASTMQQLGPSVQLLTRISSATGYHNKQAVVSCSVLHDVGARTCVRACVRAFALVSCVEHCGAVVLGALRDAMCGVYTGPRS